MRKVLYILLTIIPTIFYGQTNRFAWPLTDSLDKKVLILPGQHIGSEINTESIVLSGHINEIVISPANGTVDHIFYINNTSLLTNYVFEVKTKDDIINKKKIIENTKQPHLEIENDLSLLISIKTKNNTKVNISGLGLYKLFKTGEKIHKGDTIGYMNYFYFKKIKKPSIAINISKGGISLNPTQFFGIKKTEQHTNRISNHNLLSKEQSLYDLSILKNSLEEGYPGLYDYNTKEDVDSLFINITNDIKDTLSQFDFFKKVFFLLNKLKDSHILIQNYSSLFEKPKNQDSYHPPVYFGWINDTCFVTRTILKDTIYLNRKIKKINGISANKIKNYLYDYVSGSDGNIQSIKNFQLLTLGTFKYFDYYPDAIIENDLKLTFDNGKNIVFNSYINNSSTCIAKFPSWRDFYFHPKYRLIFETSDSIYAYLALKSFDLYETEKDSILKFINKINKIGIKTLIIDLRNNYGGKTENIPFLYNFIADSVYQIELYSKVNKTDSFKFFKYVDNYSNNYIKDIFQDFKYNKNKSGFIKFNSADYSPSTTTHFNGRIYVLINERTFSAAAIFSGLVKKYNRGVTVGRETGSTFHQLNAEKFANLKLPYSGIIIRVPLVKIVFDTITVNNPNYGRGVLPDYPVDITLKELSMEDGDVIFNRAISLINNNKYFPATAKIISQNKENPSNYKKRSIFIFAFTIFIIILLLYLIINFRNEKKK